MPATLKIGTTTPAFRRSRAILGPAVATVALLLLALTESAAAQGVPATPAQMEIRLQQLEEELRRLTGRIEELTFNLRRLEQNFERSQSDYEMRTQMGGRAAPDEPLIISGTQPVAAAPRETTLSRTAPVAEPQPPMQPAVASGPASAIGAPTVTRGASGATVLPQGAPAEDYNNAYALLLRSDYPGAERAFRAFLDAHPEDPLAGNAQYWLGETYYVREDYQQSAIHFAEGYQRYPDGPKAPANLLKLGMSLGRLGKKTEACASFDELDVKFPDAPGNVQQYARTERQRLGCR